MSYGFVVTKDADGLHLGEVGKGALSHIPDGKYQISGHATSPGTSDVETISVTLTDPDGYLRATAQAGVRKPGA